MKFKLVNGVWDTVGYGCRECCSDCSGDCGEACPLDKEVDGSCDRCIFKDGFKKKQEGVKYTS